MSNPLISWVNRCDDTECHNIVLEDILSKIKNGTWQGQVDKYRAACRPSKNGKKPTKGWVPAFTPSGRFSVRNAEGLVAHSELIPADLEISEPNWKRCGSNSRAVRMFTACLYLSAETV